MSDHLHASNGVRQVGMLSPLLFNVYMDVQSNRLNWCKTDCLVGELLINCLMYDDDLVIFFLIMQDYNKSWTCQLITTEMYYSVSCVLLI